MVALGVLAVLLVLRRPNLDQVQGAENLSAGRLPSLELRVTAVEKALLAKVNTLEFRVGELENQVFDLSQRLQFISMDNGVINGLKGPHLLITGGNVHIRSGSGATVDTTNLGNLIVGYNELRLQNEPAQGPTRSGSHNFIVGPGHEYTASGGLVGGTQNTINGVFASVSGGTGNTASGGCASVSGGGHNTASGIAASVGGGGGNMASGPGASVSGGSSNIASGLEASVSGGSSNVASGTFASVGGDPAQSTVTSGGAVSPISASFARLTLPKGTYLVTARLQYGIASILGGGFITCGLFDAAANGGAGGSIDAAIAGVIVGGTISSPSDEGTMHLISPLSYTASDVAAQKNTVDVQCQSTVLGVGSVSLIRLYALPVSSVTPQ